MKGKYEITSETINVSFENSNGKTDFVRIEIFYKKNGIVDYASAYIGSKKVLGITDVLSRTDVIEKAMNFAFVYEKF